MTRLDRTLNLLERYDELLETTIVSHYKGAYGELLLAELRAEKEKLTKELIEHGCRRRG